MTIDIKKKLIKSLEDYNNLVVTQSELYDSSKAGITNEKVLEDVVGHVFLSRAGIYMYPDSLSKAAALIYWCSKLRPFYCANEITAIFSAIWLLKEQENIDLKISSKDLNDFVDQLRYHTIDIDEIKEWISERISR